MMITTTSTAINARYEEGNKTASALLSPTIDGGLLLALWTNGAGYCCVMPSETNIAQMDPEHLTVQLLGAMTTACDRKLTRPALLQRTLDMRRRRTISAAKA